MNSYVFQFHGNKQLIWIWQRILIHFNFMQAYISTLCKRTGPFESIISYVFQFHTNKQAYSSSEFLCLRIPYKQKAHLKMNFNVFQFHANGEARLNQLLHMYSNAMQTVSPICINYFFCIPQILSFLGFQIEKP